jgi:putative acyl-CoA dehydrogenase
MALGLQASLMIRHGPSALADAFCATRLPHPAAAYGAFDAHIDTATILSRSMPPV